MGHLVLPRNVISTLSKQTMWVQLKKNPRYWFMSCVCLVTAPSLAISTIVQKVNRYDFIADRYNVSMTKDDRKYEKYLSGGN